MNYCVERDYEIEYTHGFLRVKRCGIKLHQEVVSGKTKRRYFEYHRVWMKKSWMVPAVWTLEGFLECGSNEERYHAASAVSAVATRIAQQMKQYKVQRENLGITTLPERQEAARRQRLEDVRSLFSVSHQHIWDELASLGALQEVLGDILEKRIRCKTKIDTALLAKAGAHLLRIQLQRRGL